MRLCVLSFNVNFQSGLEFHCEVVIPDNDALKPAFYQGFVEGFKVCRLLLYKILQLVDACNLCVPGGSVNRAFLALLPELEDLIGNLIIDLFVVGLFEKLFLEFLQSLVDPISGILLSASDHLCDVLLELCLVGGLIANQNFRIPRARHIFEAGQEQDALRIIVESKRVPSVVIEKAKSILAKENKTELLER